MTAFGSLRSRILISYMLMTIGLIIVLGIVHQSRLQSIIEGDFTANCQHLAKLIGRQGVSPIFTEDLEALEGLASQALSLPSLVGIGFFDDHDRPLFVRFQTDQKPMIIHASDSSTPWVDQPGLSHFAEPILMDRFDPQTSQATASQAIGKIRFRFSRSEVERQMSAMQFSLQFDLLLFAITFGLLIVILEQWVTKPLNTVITKVQSIARGEFNTRVEVPTSQGEITALCESINHMATSLDRYTFHLQTTIEEKTREIAQRERLMMFQEKMASLGRISASIAHEINNPLNFISLGVDFLDQSHRLWMSGKSSDPNEVGSVIIDVRHGVQRAKAIVDALRSFSRTDEDIVQPYRLDEAVETALRMQNHEIKQRGIKPEIQCSFTGTLNGSEMRIQQILINLIGNALDILREQKVAKPRIAIRIWKAGGEAHLAIDDNGPGVPEGIRSRLFEPFFTTKPPGKGTGLGLALCFEFANREGGRVFLGESPLGGASFELVLPLQRIK